MFVHPEWLRMIYGMVLPTLFVALIATATFLGIKSLWDQQGKWKRTAFVVPSPKRLVNTDRLKPKYLVDGTLWQREEALASRQRPL